MTELFSWMTVDFTGVHIYAFCACDINPHQVQQYLTDRACVYLYIYNALTLPVQDIILSRHSG